MKKGVTILLSILSAIFFLLIIPYLIFPVLFLPNFLTNPVFYCFPGDPNGLYAGAILLFSMFFVFLLAQFLSASPRKKKGKMMVHRPDYFLITSMGLINLAIVIVFLSLFIGKESITRSTFIILGFTCFFGAVLILIFNKNEQTKFNTIHNVLNHEPVNFYRFLKELNFSGNAYFINEYSRQNPAVLQFNPESNFWYPNTISSEKTLLSENNSRGISTIPIGSHFIKELEEVCDLKIPSNTDEIFRSIVEIGEEALEIADSVTVKRKNPDTIIIELRNFSQFSVCADLRRKYPTICQKSPCPLCSLMICLLAGGLKEVLYFSDVTQDSTSRSILLTISRIKEESSKIK